MRRAALALAALLAAPIAAGNGSDAVVIELGDRTVTKAEFDARFAIAVRLLARRQGVTLAGQDPALIENLRQQYLDQYARELVLLDEARRRQLDVSDAQVDAAFGELFADDDEVDALLGDTGLDGDRARALLERVVRDEQTVELLT
ncbi:MAG: SurA N-terminal domain-containing protein, partial [Woeseiaceae bacterium]|nr:SurA N-terminal domain-containing protein [Woeseiaceae bacterium]